MIQSVYLHKYVADTLCMFGDLSDVTNRILQEAANNDVDITNTPACASRDGASRYSIDVTQQDYLDLLQIYPINSPKVSIRRILYWFVDYAIYDSFGWKAVRQYSDKTLQSLLNRVERIQNELQRMSLIVNDERAKNKILSINEQIIDLKEYLEK